MTNENQYPVFEYSEEHPAVGGVPIQSMVRSLDADGRRPAQQVLTVVAPNGALDKQIVVGRDAIVTAEELVEMIRVVVREELDRK